MILYKFGKELFCAVGMMLFVSLTITGEESNHKIDFSSKKKEGRCSVIKLNDLKLIPPYCSKITLISKVGKPNATLDIYDKDGNIIFYLLSYRTKVKNHEQCFLFGKDNKLIKRGSFMGFDSSLSNDKKTNSVHYFFEMSTEKRKLFLSEFDKFELLKTTMNDVLDKLGEPTYKNDYSDPNSKKGRFRGYSLDYSLKKLNKNLSNIKFDERLSFYFNLDYILVRKIHDNPSHIE
jgi:hypothetical protein